MLLLSKSPFERLEAVAMDKGASKMLRCDQPVLRAHSREGIPENEWQTLVDHLTGVAEMAGEFAFAFGYRNWGRILGIMHDAGKVSELFQRRLHGSATKVDHSTLGAIEAFYRYRDPMLHELLSRMMAFAIVGHHGGMPDGIRFDDSSKRRSLRERLDSAPREDDFQRNHEAFNRLLTEEALKLPSIEELEPIPPLRPSRVVPSTDATLINQSRVFSISVLTRMLYSCLVDADYLDTERFMAPEQFEQRRGRHCDPLPVLLERLEEKLRWFASKPGSDTLVNKARRAVSDDCRDASIQAPGIFTLTVPTGGGKTLAVALFALAHAVAHGMERVIIAIPFTSIVEQTASVLRDVFGEANVLEHHSNYDFEASDEETRASERLAVQNWDAPIIVTTNVQFFESLFSNKPAKCRKLHRIARSVVVLDEAQTLPDGLLKPSLAMLEELCADFGTSIVLCTATQPALDGVWPFGTKPREIAVHRDLFDAAFASRVRFEMCGRMPMDDLVSEITEQQQCLCIVGTTDKARRVYRAVTARAREHDGSIIEGRAFQSGYFHLSANMTPEHRSVFIDLVKDRLKYHEPCIVVSTQLIEAGVDVDFPVVYRELAGVDSVLQAAGRCNREGKLDEAGVVRVFEIAEDIELDAKLAKTWLGRMKELARKRIKLNEGTIDDDMVEGFFAERYAKGDLDAKRLFKELSDSELLGNCGTTFAFEHYANEYRIINDDSMPVFVPWGDEGEKLRRCLVEGAQNGIPAAAFAMDVQKSSVNIASWVMIGYRKEGLVDDVAFAPLSILEVAQDGNRLYSDEMGLLPLGEEVQDLLIVS